MKFVVDTNVIAYYLLGTQPFSTESRRLLSLNSHAMAPAFWEAELANVLWMAIRAGVLAAEEGPARLKLAQQLAVDSVPVRPLCRAALERSVTSGIAVYDTLFIELAVREDCPLATFDKAVLKKFPEIAVRPGALVH